MNLDAVMEVRPAGPDDWQPAMVLAWRTFVKYDAKDYTEEGIANFKEFVTDTSLYRNFCEGRYPLFVAYIQDELVGMITLRNGNHISLLFVEGEHHREGIGKALILYACDFLREELKLSAVTVFAAPYAYHFYRALGFKAIAGETQRDGMIFTPMEYVF